MIYKNTIYLAIIFFNELFIYFSLGYGHAHTENHYILQSGDISNYHIALIRFNIIIFLSHVLMISISYIALKGNKNKINRTILLISLINILITVKFIFSEVHSNYIDVKEVSIFPFLKSNIFYADIYYCLPTLWAIIYFIYIYRNQISFDK